MAATIQFQAFNQFRKPITGLQVHLELTASPSLLYIAETTREPIAKWYPILSELQDVLPYEELVAISPGQRYHITVRSNRWIRTPWPSITLTSLGNFPISILHIGLCSYKISLSTRPQRSFSLSARNLQTRHQELSREDADLESLLARVDDDVTDAASDGEQGEAPRREELVFDLESSIGDYI